MRTDEAGSDEEEDFEPGFAKRSELYEHERKLSSIRFKVDIFFLRVQFLSSRNPFFVHNAHAPLSRPLVRGGGDGGSHSVACTHTVEFSGARNPPSLS